MTERITTPFGAKTTALEVIEGVDLSGKHVIVTGGASGIGIETARALAQAGASVTVAVRNIKAGEDVAAHLKETTRNPNIYVGRLDLADVHSVDAFTKAWKGPLHVLVNNAGIMASPEVRTPQGWEMQFATNHLGHFALTTGLHDALTEAEGARVVMVSSVGHINGEVVFDDIHFERRPYDRWQAYGQSKTANILFAVEASKRWAKDKIMVNALNPGRISSTNLSRYISDTDTPPPPSVENSTGVSVKNREQGAATSVLLAASPLVEGVTGRYFEDCNEAEPAKPGIRRGVAAYALDPANANRLWEISLDMVRQA